MNPPKIVILDCGHVSYSMTVRKPIANGYTIICSGCHMAQQTRIWTEAEWVKEIDEDSSILNQVD